MATLWCLSAPPMLSPPKLTSSFSPVGGCGGGGGLSTSSICSNWMMTIKSHVTRRSINSNNHRTKSLVVCMAPEEEKMTRRSPLDFPIEWERPKPGRRPDIFPQFSPMKTPLPPPLPADPPEEDEEEEEEKKEEEEEDPDKEEPENPDKK